MLQQIKNRLISQDLINENLVTRANKIHSYDFKRIIHENQGNIWSSLAKTFIPKLHFRIPLSNLV